MGKASGTGWDGECAYKELNDVYSRAVLLLKPKRHSKASAD